MKKFFKIIIVVIMFVLSLSLFRKVAKLITKYTKRPMAKLA